MFKHKEYANEYFLKSESNRCMTSQFVILVIFVGKKVQIPFLVSPTKKNNAIYAAFVSIQLKRSFLHYSNIF